MRILTVDIGTGTQDIFLYDSTLDIENGFKLVVPSPTMIVHRKIKAATERGRAVLLTGVTMGGGPSQWAAEAHIQAGFPVYATPEAARTFNDELDLVAEMGIRIVSEDEAAALAKSTLRIALCDFDFAAIQNSLGSFGVSLDDLAAVSVAVFDHGNAPAGVSDRQFRFDYLDERLRSVPFGRQPLSAFAFRAEEIPSIMTRLQAVAQSARLSGLDDTPLVVMDTAPAAVLGATFDPRVGARDRVMIANVGNFHTLAFRLGPQGVEGVLEHHTGLIDRARLEWLLRGLAAGTLQHTDVFNEHGHGALVYSTEPLPIGLGDYDVAVTGPRRSILNPGAGVAFTGLRPFQAAPFGDMMLAGCFGMLAATAEVLPEFGEEIKNSLSGNGPGNAPWDEQPFH